MKHGFFIFSFLIRFHLVYEFISLDWFSMITDSRVKKWKNIDWNVPMFLWQLNKDTEKLYSLENVVDLGT